MAALFRSKVGLKSYITPYILERPVVDLNPKIPVNAAGILILLPISVDKLRGTHLVATSPASPPELPPHDLLFCHGEMHLPNI